MNLLSNFLAPAAATPDQAALLEADRQISYRDLIQLAGGAAVQLREANVSPGDRIALIGSNSIDLAVAYLATLWVGAIAVPINPKAASFEIAAQLTAVSPAGVMALSGFGGAVPSEFVPMAIDVYRRAENVPIEPRGASDVAVLLFTSGTAGAAKAAMLSHGNLAANLASVRDTQDLSLAPNDVGFAALPWFHIFGLNVGLGLGLAAGVPIVIADAYDPAGTAAQIERHGVTVLATVPTMLRAWLDLPGLTATTFRSVRLCVSGAAPLDSDLVERVQQRFGLELHDGYGLTEASPIIATTAMGAPRDGSIGTPIPGVSVRLVDTDGNDVVDGDPGEIWAHGANVFLGYWNDPEATASVLANGWLKTGDIATRDEDGYLYLVDRAKDLIIVSGFNVYPGEVEAVLIEHPDVAEAAVVGISDERTGEAVRAFVRPVEGRPADPQELTTWCRSYLSRYKCPTEIEVVSELPKGATGKVLRRVLRTE